MRPPWASAMVCAVERPIATRSIPPEGRPWSSPSAAPDTVSTPPQPPSPTGCLQERFKMKFHLGFIVVSRTVYIIPVCGLRAVIDIPNILSPLPVVDHYGVLSGAIPPFPTCFPSHLRPRTPIRRGRTPRVDQATGSDHSRRGRRSFNFETSCWPRITSVSIFPSSI
jgi:hypothetical protein